jgi:hypothetical protein
LVDLFLQPANIRILRDLEIPHAHCLAASPGNHAPLTENYAAVFLTSGIAALLALALITVQGHAPPKAL